MCLHPGAFVSSPSARTLTQPWRTVRVGLHECAHFACALGRHLFVVRTLTVGVACCVNGRYYAQRDKVPDLCTRGLGLSILHDAPVSRPSPKIRVRVCPEAGKEVISSGFEPAKALVRGLPLPRPRLAPLSHSGGHMWARPLIDWLQKGSCTSAWSLGAPLVLLIPSRRSMTMSGMSLPPDPVIEQNTSLGMR